MKKKKKDVAVSGAVCRNAYFKLMKEMSAEPESVSPGKGTFLVQKKIVASCIWSSCIELRIV